MVRGVGYRYSVELGHNIFHELWIKLLLKCVLFCMLCFFFSSTSSRCEGGGMFLTGGIALHTIGYSKSHPSGVFNSLNELVQGVLLA